MAVKLTKKGFTVNLGNSVSQAIENIKAVRSTEQAKKNTAFQQAVASGMSYTSQVELLKKMISDEQNSPFADQDYIASLNISLGTTQKMARFETIRGKYKDALDSYVQDKGTLDSYINVLQDSLNNEVDDQMRGELRDLLSKARSEKAQNEMNAISNRALLAQKDNSQSLIDKSIAEVTDKKAKASLAGNDDEVAQWDQTLLALKSSKSKLQIEDGLNDMVLKINKNNAKANDKISYYNEEVSKADASTPVTYNGVTYGSLKEFWQGQRDDYIQNSYFQEAQKDLDAETAKIAAKNDFGQVPVARIQAVANYFDIVKNTDGFQNYADRIDQQKTANVSTMVTNLASSLQDEVNAKIAQGTATQNDITRAENLTTNLESTFGIKVSRPAFSGELGKGKNVAGTIDNGIKDLPPTPSASSLLPENVAEIKRAQDVYLNADKLAGTGKYVGQTADQIRENAHVYANRIRSGEVNLVGTTPAPTTTPVAPAAPATPQPGAGAGPGSQPLKPTVTPSPATPTPAPTTPAPTTTPATNPQAGIIPSGSSVTKLNNSFAYKNTGYANLQDALDAETADKKKTTGI